MNSEGPVAMWTGEARQALSHIKNPPRVARRSALASLVARRLPLVARHSPLATRRSPLVARHSPLVTTHSRRSFTRRSSLEAQVPQPNRRPFVRCLPNGILAKDHAHPPGLNWGVYGEPGWATGGGRVNWGVYGEPGRRLEGGRELKKCASARM